MQPWTQKGGTQLQRDFANRQCGKNYQQEHEAEIEVQFQLMVRPSTAAIWRTSRISCSNSAGRMDCGPSESARSGSWWTSTSNPSAPTATAARDSGNTLLRRPVPCEGSTTMGRWLRFCTAGTTARSSVLRVKSEKVRTPRSHKITA